MITATIANKEAMLVRRDSLLKYMFFALIVVMLGAVLLSAARTATFENERADAAAADKEVWEDQGARNPHSAAHFSRYAFKPIPTLAAFDPGTVDYSGLAVWMEAHSRNPATFRYAESGGALSRFASLSPAWVLQTLMPLVIILLLFGSYAGERENGTLRQLLSSGVSSQAIFSGKLKGALRSLGSLFLPLAALIAISLIAFGGGAPQQDLLPRLLLILLAYSIYLFAFAMTAMGISALCDSRRTAAIALFTFWFFASVLMPRLAADAATTATPQPNGFETDLEVNRIGSAFWGSGEAREAVQKQALEDYNVEKLEDLPIDFAAYELQASEEYADPMFDALYAGLDANHAAQEKTLDLLAILSPTLAINRLSAGLAGTDRQHHVSYLTDAEMHRRQIVKQMNDDMMLNAGDAGYNYQSDPEFWQKIADFNGQPPALSAHIHSYVWPFVLLILWALGSFLFARRSAFRASVLETIR